MENCWLLVPYVDYNIHKPEQHYHRYCFRDIDSALVCIVFASIDPIAFEHCSVSPGLLLELHSRTSVNNAWVVIPYRVAPADIIHSQYCIFLARTLSTAAWVRLNGTFEGTIAQYLTPCAAKESHTVNDVAACLLIYGGTTIHSSISILLIDEGRRQVSHTVAAAAAFAQGTWTNFRCYCNVTGMDHGTEDACAFGLVDASQCLVRKERLNSETVG